MYHYVLFQLKPGFSIDAMEHLYERTYLCLKETLPGIKETSFLRNCISRESNMDVMITVRMNDREILGQYLQHPLHLKFIEGTQDYVVQRVSFDWEGEEKDD